MNDDERLYYNRFIELANNCYLKNIPVITDFLDLNKQSIFCNTVIMNHATKKSRELLHQLDLIL